jgi:hypothetical protein
MRTPARPCVSILAGGTTAFAVRKAAKVFIQTRKCDLPLAIGNKIVFDECPPQ